MPTIEATIAAQRQRIAAREEPIYAALRRAYGQAIERLATDLAAVTTRIEEAIAAGEPVGEAWLLREARYQRLLTQAEGQFTRFGGEAQRIIQVGSRLAATAGATDAATLLDAAGLRIGTANLPTVATERLVASFAPESPLTAVLKRYGAEGRAVIEQRLIEAVTGGLGPRQVAGQIARDLDSPGQRARLLALTRTEMMRSFRGGTSATYQGVAHLLDGVRWIAAKSPRTCLACISLDGTLFPVDYVMESHTSCRCTTVSEVSGSSIPPPETGADWLARQPEATQRTMLGSAYDGYRSGDVALADFVGVRDDPRWGRSLHQRSNREVLTDPGGRYTPPSVRRASTEPVIPDGPFASPIPDGELYGSAELSTKTVAEATKVLGGKTGRAWNEYKGGGYEAINASLRQGGSFTNADIARMAEYKKQKLTKHAILYRGVEPTPAAVARFDTMVPGDGTTDPGFVSTSFTEVVAQRFRGDTGGYLFEIEAPPGLRYVPLDDRGANEDELVLPPGTTFFVMRRRAGADSETIFTVIPLPPGTDRPPADVDARQYAQKKWSKWRVE